MVVTHNLMANFMSRQLNINTNTKSKAAERLGSGYKINRASDNAAGLAISEKMRGQIRGLERASENIQDGIAFSNVADGALSEVHSLIQRMRELSVRAANDTYVEEDREIIDEEINWLKKEINHIARDTEYNTYKIFCEDFAVELSDDVNVVKIFNAEDGNPNSPSTYGGIIVGNDIRVKWEDIDPNMVYIDAATNEMMFNKGEYTCTAGGYDLTITCEDGSQPPKIKASFSVDALASGLQVADKLVPWQDVVNEDGTCILNCSPIKGYFSFSVGDGEGVFYAPGCNDINEVINGINSFNNNHNRVYSNIYVGYGREQAVDIVSSNKYKVQVDNSISTAIQNGASLNDLGLKLVADTTGIHLLDMAGTVLSGSEKTWQDLGMAEWDTGDDISDTKAYTYSYQDGNYNISFNFEVLDETSMESVIDGINGAFKMESTEASNQTAVEETGTNINSVSIVSSSNQLSIYEQAVLGREFDVETDEFASENMTYDETANQFKLTYPATGTPELEYVSTSITGYSQIKNDSELYQKYLIAREVQALLSGDAKSDKSLTDIITAQNVTAENYLSETITINKNTMLTTPGINNGSTYPAAHMDFSGLGTSYGVVQLSCMEDTVGSVRWTCWELHE